MKTKIIEINLKNPELKIIKKVAKEIKKGKIVVYPTETCYGLGTNALNERAVSKIYEIKKEPTRSNLIAIISNLETAKKFGKIDRTVKRIVKRFMPGPLTLIVEKRKNYPNLTNTAFAFRISSNKVAHLLAKYAEVPITATSANIHGKASIYSSEEVKKEFFGKVDIILDAGNLEKVKPSTIVDMRSKEPKLIRKGPIPFEEVLKVIKVKLARSRLLLQNLQCFLLH